MTKRALYSTASGAVLQFQDTLQFSYAEHPEDTQLLLLPDDFVEPEGARWVRDGAITDRAPTAPAPAPAPPTVVTMRQARLALLAGGKLDDVDAALDAMDDRAARIEWEFATTVERSSPFVQLLAGALDLDETALDGLFTEAAAL